MRSMTSEREGFSVSAFGSSVATAAETVPEFYHHAGFNPANAKALVEGIEESVFEHAHLVALLLSQSYIDFRAAEAVQVRGGHGAMWRRLGAGQLVEERVLVLDRYSRFPANEQLLQALGYPQE